MHPNPEFAFLTTTMPGKASKKRWGLEQKLLILNKLRDWVRGTNMSKEAGKKWAYSMRVRKWSNYNKIY